jgi:alpha-D-xyloside xylohydrolase
MRALFMDFPKDPKAATVGDQYMLGKAFLVAPVTEQGQTKKSVYLPAGTAWYDYWTNRRYEGGQTIEADAPIEHIPVFVRAGSIVPIGAQVDSTASKQALEASASIPAPMPPSRSMTTMAPPMAIAPGRTVARPSWCGMTPAAN